MTDAQIIEHKLISIGAELMGKVSTIDEVKQQMRVCFWRIADKSLIICEYAGGGVGLYGFLGAHGDPVKRDLEMIDEFAGRSILDKQEFLDFQFDQAEKRGE